MKHIKIILFFLLGCVGSVSAQQNHQGDTGSGSGSIDCNITLPSDRVDTLITSADTTFINVQYFANGLCEVDSILSEKNIQVITNCPDGVITMFENTAQDSIFYTDSQGNTVGFSKFDCDDYQFIDENANTLSLCDAVLHRTLYIVGGEVRISNMDSDDASVIGTTEHKVAIINANNAEATAVGALAHGSSTKATGPYSTAWNIFSEANANYSNAFNRSIANGVYSFSINRSTAIGSNSFAYGNTVDVVGNFSAGGGFNSTVNCDYCDLHGRDNILGDSGTEARYSYLGGRNNQNHTSTSTLGVGQDWDIDGNSANNIIAGSGHDLTDVNNSSINGTNLVGSNFLRTISSGQSIIATDITNSLITGSQYTVDTLFQSFVGGREHSLISDVSNSVINGSNNRVLNTINSVIVSVNADVEGRSHLVGGLNGNNSNLTIIRGQGNTWTTEGRSSYTGNIGIESDNSVSIGGINNYIPVGANRTAILVGSNYSAPANVTDMVYMPKATIYNIPNYATDAAADADATLPNGGLYILTGQRDIKIKP